MSYAKSGYPSKVVDPLGREGKSMVGYADIASARLRSQCEDDVRLVLAE